MKPRCTVGPGQCREEPVVQLAMWPAQTTSEGWVCAGHLLAFLLPVHERVEIHRRLIGRAA